VLAILSDIHGNLEALLAVGEDALQHGVTEVYCLGDIAGYGGPNPRECVELAMGWSVVIQGNQDLALFRDLDGYPDSARQALYWAADQLRAPVPSDERALLRLGFLAGLRPTHQAGPFLFAHASPRDPMNEYVFPDDMHNAEKMTRIFNLINQYCIVGHTHVPGVFTQEEGFRSPEDLNHVWKLDKQKAMVNVGSVGQPRDDDWRACYVLLDGDTVRFRRVEYDLDATIRKIRDIDEIDNFQGNRLREGR
jgi:diadenosine tetraphosphatase ApaH/serine/threonine PP2A family protein phosphatase